SHRGLGRGDVGRRSVHRCRAYRRAATATRSPPSVAPARGRTAACHHLRHCIGGTASTIVVIVGGGYPCHNLSAHRRGAGTSGSQRPTGSAASETSVERGERFERRPGAAS